MSSIVDAMQEGKILLAEDQDAAYMVRKGALALTVTTYKAVKNDDGTLSLGRQDVQCFQSIREAINFLSTKGELYVKDIT